MVNNGVCKVVEVGPIQLSEESTDKLYYTLDKYMKEEVKYIPLLEIKSTNERQL